MKKYILIACVAFLSGWIVNGFRLNLEIEEIKNAHANALIQAQKEAMAESVRRVDEAERIANEATKQKEKALADARNADAISKRLRNSLRTYSTSNCTAIGSQSTNTAGNLCTDLFARIDDASGIIAKFADESRIAGLACEKQYNSIYDASRKNR